MAKYTENFTLEDLFLNTKLRKRMPRIYLNEKEGKTGIGIRTRIQSIQDIVYKTAVQAGQPHYNPFTPSRNGLKMVMTGTCITSTRQAQNAIYTAIKSTIPIIRLTANSADFIRDALKESYNNRRKYGINSKLLLRANSMEEINGMSTQAFLGMYKNIVENIVFGDNFPETQKKYNVFNAMYQDQNGNIVDYNTARDRFLNKVGR